MATNCFSRNLKVSARAIHYAEEIVELLRLHLDERLYIHDADLADGQFTSWLAGYFESYGHEARVGRFQDGASQEVP